MDVSGLIRTTCAPEVLVTALYDARFLAAVMPQGSRVDQTAEGAFTFSVTRNLGPIKLTLPGTMTIAQKGKRRAKSICVRASHIIGGKVDLDLDIRFEVSPDHTQLIYTGELAATGLAGRVLREYATRVNGALKAALTRLAVLAEGQTTQGA